MNQSARRSILQKALKDQRYTDKGKYLSVLQIIPYIHVVELTKYIIIVGPTIFQK